MRILPDLGMRRVKSSKWNGMITSGLRIFTMRVVYSGMLFQPGTHKKSTSHRWPSSSDSMKPALPE